MSLDIHNVAQQIDDATSQIREQNKFYHQQLNKSYNTLLRAEATEIETKRISSNTNFLIPGISKSLSTKYRLPELPKNYSVLAVDGSHIDVDRHLPIQCCLINIGKVHIRYGESPSASLSNNPRLFSDKEDLQLHEISGNRSQTLEGPLLGALRAVEEMVSLADLMKETGTDVPSLALIDGSLILWSIIGQTYPDFVRSRLLDDMFLPALDRLHEISKVIPLALASYISLPRSKEITNALRLEKHNCHYQNANCSIHCGSLTTGDRPCDGFTQIMDRNLFDELLEVGERSESFASTSSIVERYYDYHKIHFYYLNVGNEISRIEIPEWVNSNDYLLDLTHAALVKQCENGHGYPVALMEAHEQAVVTNHDREEFRKIIEDALARNNLPNYTSEKNRSKRIKWL